MRTRRLGAIIRDFQMGGPYFMFICSTFKAAGNCKYPDFPIMPNGTLYFIRPIRVHMAVGNAENIDIRRRWNRPRKWHRIKCLKYPNLNRQRSVLRAFPNARIPNISDSARIHRFGCKRFPMSIIGNPPCTDPCDQFIVRNGNATGYLI